MAARPFLKRGAGTTDKYKVNYPVTARSRQSVSLSSPPKQGIDLGGNEVHYASAPVRRPPNASYEELATSMVSLVYEGRAINAESGGRTDSGRGSREAHTPEKNQRDKFGYQSLEYIAPDPLRTSRTNDSGLSESPEARGERDSQHYRTAFSDPDQSRDEPLPIAPQRNQLISLGAYPATISEETQNVLPSTRDSDDLSSLGTKRSTRVLETRASARAAINDNKRCTPTMEISQNDTMDNVSEISSLTTSSSRRVLRSSNGQQRIVEPPPKPQTVQDSHFFQKNIGPLHDYRPLRQLVPSGGTSVASSIAAAVPSQGTKRLPAAVERCTQANSTDFPRTQRPEVRLNEKPKLNINEVPKVADPITFTPRHQPNRGLSTLESHLARQLRDTIINVDFAEAEMRQRFHDLERDVWNREQALEDKRKVQEEAFQRERAEIEREKGSLGRLSKAQKKGSNEKENELAKQLDDAKESNGKIYSQVIDLRNKLKRSETEVEDLRKAKEKEKAKAERLQGRIDQLQSEVAVQRGRFAMDKTRNDRDVVNSQKAQATFNLQTRKNFHTDTATNRRICREDSGVSDVLSSRNGSTSGKNVHWADQRHSTSDSLTTKQYKLFSAESTSSCRRRTFIAGGWTKSEERDCGCTLFEYHTGDIFWKRPEVEVYYYMRIGVNEVQFTNGPVFRLFRNGQFDFIRVDGQTTSIRPDGTRFERKLNVSMRWICQKFTPDRDPLRNGANIAFEYAGMGIWFTDGGFVKISTKELRISLSAPQDEGKITHVVMKDKIPCFYWGHQKRHEDRNRVLNDNRF
ncbi:unnamed protein product, partial [Mesorhabditis belari]|uniref:Uncharacterized protein n=1 Tax=Mesorhabditis belari TaxID=2138241 RepID=A0AAF3FHR5_9BILA